MKITNEIINNKHHGNDITRSLFGIGSHEYTSTSLSDKLEALKHFRDVDNEQILKLVMEYMEFYQVAKNLSKEQVLFDVVVSLTQMLDEKL